MCSQPCVCGCVSNFHCVSSKVFESILCTALLCMHGTIVDAPESCGCWNCICICDYSCKATWFHAHIYMIASWALNYQFVERWVFFVAPWFCLQQLLHKSSRSTAGLVGHTLNLNSTGFRKEGFQMGGRVLTACRCTGSPGGKVFDKWEGYSQHAATGCALTRGSLSRTKGTHRLAQHCAHPNICCREALQTGKGTGGSKQTVWTQGGVHR